MTSIRRIDDQISVAPQIRPEEVAQIAAAGFVDVAPRTVPGWQRSILHTFVARKPEA